MTDVLDSVRGKRILVAGDVMLDRYWWGSVGRISPEEMTIDPIFEFSEDVINVSNVHDLTGMKPETFWNCDNAPINIEFDPAAIPEGLRRLYP